MNQEEIKQVIPHRDHMLLVQEAEKTSDTTSRGKYTVSGEEFFLKGHFPGNPVVPGVILCEMMAQSSCVMLADKVSGKTPYFTKMDNVKFKGMVKPGDTLVTECELTRSRGNFYFISAKGYVNDKLCVSADFSFALI